MPYYDYKCLDCEKEIEVMQSMNDPALVLCESCGGQLKKLISGGTGVIFKGQGFYANDSKKKPECATKECGGACQNN